MGKVISERFAGPDDPIYSGGVETFSHRSSSASTKSSANATGGATLEKSDSADEDSPGLAARRVAQMRHRNQQLLNRSKGRRK